MSKVIDIHNLCFSYNNEKQIDQHEVLSIEELSIQQGDKVFVYGPSGSGKTTFLNILSGTIRDYRGEVNILGQNIAKMSASRMDSFRAEHIGLIFQQFNLLPYLSMIDNVCIACQFSKKRLSKATQQQSLKLQAKQILSHLGLEDFDRPVSKLSIGQQQRVAAARAFIGEPDLIIADEATSALDIDSQSKFIELLKAQADKSNITIVFISHNIALKSHFDYAIDFKNLNSALAIQD